MEKQETYAALLRRGMRNLNMTRRGLERALKAAGKGYSYEHVRRITGGTPVMSEQFNADVCAVLSLDEEDMWQVAAREKLKTNSRTATLMATMAPDSSLKPLWAQLTATDREQVIKIMEGMVEQRRAERSVNTGDPESIRRRIHEYTELLANSVRPGQHGRTTRKRASQ